MVITGQTQEPLETEPPSSTPGILWGAAAAGVSAAVAAWAAETRKKREEEEARQREEMERQNEQARQREKEQQEAYARDLASLKRQPTALSAAEDKPLTLDERIQQAKDQQRAEMLAKMTPDEIIAWGQAQYHAPASIQPAAIQEQPKSLSQRIAQGLENILYNSITHSVEFQALSFISSHNENVKRGLTTTVLPKLADLFSSTADSERNPRAAQIYNQIWNGVDAWDGIVKIHNATGRYTADAIADGRWSDVWKGTKALVQEQATVNKYVRQAMAMTVVDIVVAGNELVMGHPQKLVGDVINFYRAGSERLQGKDRFWDVLWTGSNLNADVAGIYMMAKPVGLVDRANAGLSKLLFGQEIPSKFMPYFLKDSLFNGGINRGLLNNLVNSSKAMPSQTMTQALLRQTSLANQARWLFIRDQILQNAPPHPSNADLSAPGQFHASDQLLPDEGLLVSTDGSPFNPDEVIVAPRTSESTYLWAIDKDVNMRIALEKTFAPTSRGNIVHSNLVGGDQARLAGEMWFVGENKVVINGGSGRYGPTTPEAMQLAANYWEAMGYDVKSLGWDYSATPPRPMRQPLPTSWFNEFGNTGGYDTFEPPENVLDSLKNIWESKAR